MNIKNSGMYFLSRYRLILFIIIISASSGIGAAPLYLDFHNTPLTHISVISDTLTENQLLYNGRIWKNVYFNVEGDQFIFSKTFMPGSVVIRGNRFPDISIMYDIYNDEILIPFNKGGVIQLNKQMVDSFTFHFQNKEYHFTKMQIDSLDRYVQIIYKGKTALYIRYSKKIEKLAEQGKYDMFYQRNQVLFVKDNKVYPVAGKRDLLNILHEDKEAVNGFIKKNRIRISKTDPESLVPVIRYLDTLSH
jgi:hypothetical protein